MIGNPLQSENIGREDGQKFTEYVTEKTKEDSKQQGHYKILKEVEDLLDLPKQLRA